MTAQIIPNPDYNAHTTEPWTTTSDDCDDCAALLTELARLRRTHARCIDLQIALTRLLEAAEHRLHQIEEEQARRPRPVWCACQGATTIGDAT